ncbi:hypothetical protein [Luteimonas sp. MC1828]|uniref:hypothetical protein n=1 Tax=Luteimonas sp. MC1828 TaxID=2799787 RepID=UPI0018F129B7|nr:hypothetical protein [Luteimonas sp. MC1828]MBJ7573843.1 hypothetical protein [Luteimonas sp. MC1828]
MTSLLAWRREVSTAANAGNVRGRTCGCSSRTMGSAKSRDGALLPPQAFDYAPTTHNTVALAVDDLCGDGCLGVVVGHDGGFTVFVNRGCCCT